MKAAIRKTAKPLPLTVSDRLERDTAPEGLGGRIFKAFSAHLFGYGVRLTNRLFLPPLFLKAWGTDAYGDWLTISSLLFFFSLSDLGARYYLNNQLTVKILSKRYREFARTFTAAVWITVVVASLAGGLYLSLFDQRTFGKLLVGCLALQFLCTALEQILTSAFRALGRAHHGIALANAAELTQVLLVAGLLLRGVPQGPFFALGYLVPHLLVVGLSLLLLRRQVRTEWNTDRTEIAHTFRQASPFFSTLLSEALVLQGLLTLLAWICDPADVAAWGTLRTMANLAFVVQSSLTLATWPELVRLMEGRKTAQAGRLFRIQVRASLFLCSFLLLVLGWTGPLIYGHWLGGKILFDGQLFALMLLYTFVNGFWGTFQKFALVTESLPTVGRITLGASLFTVTLSLVLGKIWGVIGYTAGMVLAELIFPAWYFPWRIRKRFTEVSNELFIAAGCGLLLVATHFRPSLHYALVPLSLGLVIKEHQRLRGLARSLKKTMVLAIALLTGATAARAEDFFHVVRVAKTEAKNCAQLREALASQQAGIVALAPGVDYRIQCTIDIPDNRTLWIPANSTITFTASTSERTALRITGTGQLLGNGSVRVLPGSALLDKASPRTGVLVTGSEASIQLGKVEGFEYGLYLLGENRGCAYNDIRVRKILNALQAVKLNATGTGWVNQNYIHVSRIAHSLREKNPNWVDTYGIYLDSESAHAPNTNRFSGSIENTRYGIHLTGLYNRLDGLRLELDSLPTVAAVRVEIGQTSFTEKNCALPKKPKGCIPTQDNWWFGEWGRVQAGDVVTTDSFKNFEGASVANALQGFGISGLRSLSGKQE